MTRLLWPHLQRTRHQPGVAEAQWLYEMCVQGTAVWARNHVAVVAEEIQPLCWMQNRFIASVALKTKDYNY